MLRVCVFDVIETLLDLKALDPYFERVFGTGTARTEWFNQMLQSALVATISDAYTDFGRVGGAALDMIAARRSLQLTVADRQQILGAVRSLPAHGDVLPGLERLQAAGFRLAALTNSTAEVAREQLYGAGLDRYFEQILSADQVRRFKPSAAVYQMAAEQLGVEPVGMRLIAAHSWDVAGALRAGCAAAFVARPGKVLDPLAAAPDVIGATLTEVATQIVQIEVATS